MQRRRLQLLKILVIIAASAAMGTSAAMAQGKLVSGKLAGVVRDLSGTPQMGASVEVFAEAPGVTSSHGAHRDGIDVCVARTIAAATEFLQAGA